MTLRYIREFIKLESSAGIILLGTAIIALIIDNTPLSHAYHILFDTPLTIQLGVFAITKPFLLWINDGFMALFFLLVGLEIKREMIEGELNSVRKAALPAIAAFGGMLLPALIYFFLNRHDAIALRGWAIPTATDIAFSLAVLALMGSRIPISLKIFLTALAIFDDIGAILIIAIFYTHHISIELLLIAAGLIILLLLLNRFRVPYLTPYLVIGVILWLVVLESGVQATLAGILLAFTIPLSHPKRPNKSPLRALEHKLHPWVAFAILPLFAFANSGVSFQGLGWQHFFGSITVGIALGLFIGKQIGIWGASMIAIKLKLARMPASANGFSIYGISLIAGVGFTMSLFIGSLAFSHQGEKYAAYVRVGVILGSILSVIVGYIYLRWYYRGERRYV